jgi:hypothetical protein
MNSQYLAGPKICPMYQGINVSNDRGVKLSMCQGYYSKMVILNTYEQLFLPRTSRPSQ